MKKAAFVLLAASLIAVSCAHKKKVAKAPAPAQPAASQRPKLELDKTEYNFGAINEGETPSITFTVTNRGREPLIISEVTRPCGCTTPTYNTAAIPYGKSDTIKVSYSSEGRPGYFIKTMLVKSNDPERPAVEISILGEVIARPKAPELPRPLQQKPKE